VALNPGNSLSGRTWFNGSWTAREWKVIRLIFVLVWFPWIPITVFSYADQPVPTGLARFVDLSWLGWPGINVFVTGITAAACWFYLRGKRMFWATGTMLVLGVLVFTLHDSQGAFMRNEVLNLILLGQMAALIQQKWKPIKSEGELRNRLIFNSQQMLLATYFISGISKVVTSGLGWVTDSPNISQQIYKAQMSLYYSVEWPFLQDLGVFFSELVAAHPLITQVVFAGTLLLELVCGVALLNRRIARWIGWMLVAMHAGIFVLLGVLFIPYVAVVVIFLIGLSKQRKEELS
jgi:hypothetical protein